MQLVSVLALILLTPALPPATMGATERIDPKEGRR
jgi:hypothetical protein